MIQTRRSFLYSAGAAGATATLRPDALARVLGAAADASTATPEELASNEDFWFHIQRAYDVDRSIVNLNNGGVAPAPSTVLSAMFRNLAQTNHAPSRQLWAVLDPQVETVRRRLADHFGCDAEEIAITRNSSEALQTCLFGIDLKPGDEVLSTSHDYPRMLNTLKQRELREGIVLRTFPFDTPPKSGAELAALFEKNLTPRTRIILLCHITNLTGQIFPVKEVVGMARRHGVEVVVDGAHAFAHFPFKHADLDCDYYGTSLHKWLSAPIGTGFLFVRKSKIAGLWPLMAAPDPKKDDIRKFEEIGTHPTAPRLAIAEALTFYEGLGPQRKLARLIYLRNRHAERLTKLPKVRCYTSLAPGMGGAICTLGIEGVEADALTGWLWDKHKIIVTPIKIEQVNGVRVTPNTYTTIEEVDRFADAFEHAVRQGIA